MIPQSDCCLDRALVHGFESLAFVIAASPPIRLRKDQGRCGYYAQRRPSLYQTVVLFGLIFFFQKENHHISQQRPSFFSTFMLLDFSDPTVWGHEEQSQEWFLEEVETPPGNTSFFLASSPEFPTGSCVRQAGGWMAWGLPPSLPSRFLEAHPELMTVSRLQSRSGLHRAPLQAHSNSLLEEKLRSPRREGADSDQQLQNGCWPCQHKQLLNFHYKRFSSTRGTLCITEIASHPKRSTLKRGPCGTRSSWAKSIYPSTEILTAEQDAAVDSGLCSQNSAFWTLPGSIN